MSTTRRTFLAGTAPVVLGLTGTIIGVPTYRGTGPDLSGPAEAWLNDALALGLWVGLGPDGKLWQGSSIIDGPDREAARQQHRIKLYARPRLERAVRNLARNGYQQQVIA